MTNFDAARFSITVRKETTEDGEMFVARVSELPDVAIYGDSYDYAYEGAIETIEAAKEVFDLDNSKFPEPEIGPNNEYSGRLPVRTSKTLHRSLVLQARREGVSLNAFVNLLLTREDTINLVCKKVEDSLAKSTTTAIVDSETIKVDTPDNNAAITERGLYVTTFH